MRKFTSQLLVFIMVASGSIFAQSGETPEPMFKFNFYGYISYEAYVDTYESVITRDGELYLYPKKPNVHSVTGKDLNENFQTNMLALQSRPGVKITGPEVMGAKTLGVFEADFFGTAEEYKNLLRLRHAYFSMKWEKTTMLMGMYWHPLFTPECFPGVIGFGAAVPYNPLNRSPQVRVDYQATENIKLVAVAAEHSQGYHHSVGPEFSQRNAEIPDIQLQAQIKAGPALLGIGGGYHELQPRSTVFTLDGNRRVKHINEEKMKAFNAIAFLNITVGDLNIKAKSVVGQNLSHQVMLGGYGRIYDDMLPGTDSIVGDPLRLGRDTTFVGNPNFRFAGLITHANWIDISYKATDNISIGFFAGLSGNLGANEKITKTKNTFFYDRNADIAYMMRFAPRVSYTVKKLRFAFEYFHDRASYASQFDEYYKPKTDDLKTGINHRFLFSAMYSFN